MDEIFPIELYNELRWRITVSEIVFVGQFEVFVCLDFVHFFSMATKLIGLQTDVTSLKIVDLFQQDTYLRNKKHMLTYQGGTGCYRAVNYQPGS